MGLVKPFGTAPTPSGASTPTTTPTRVQWREPRQTRIQRRGPRPATSPPASSPRKRTTRCNKSTCTEQLSTLHQREVLTSDAVEGTPARTMPDRCPTGVFGAAVSAEGEVTPLTVHQILEPSLFVFLLIATYLSYCCKGGVSLAEPVPGVCCLLWVQQSPRRKQCNIRANQPVEGTSTAPRWSYVAGWLPAGKLCNLLVWRCFCLARFEDL